jgi:hypothetical protein
MWPVLIMLYTPAACCTSEAVISATGISTITTIDSRVSRAALVGLWPFFCSSQRFIGSNRMANTMPQNTAPE